MTAPSKSLKEENAKFIWAVVLGDVVIVFGLLFPLLLGEVLSDVLPKAFGASVAPLVVFFLTSLLPSDVKAAIVFLRVHDILPGHRAFTVYGAHDSRVDLVRLRRKVGGFPKTPRGQNTTWYSLYKEVESEAGVILAHRHYLLFRDIAGISLLLLPVVVGLLFVLGSSGRILILAAGFFLLQYALSAIAARNQGVRLVTNVLAIHSARN
jgi:hypothetical protein